MEDVNERLLVAVRLRPTSKKENAYEHVSIVARRLDSHTVITSDPLLTDDRPRDRLYTFDHVFDQDASQSLVFEHTTKPLLNSVIQGQNASVFAYGATGAGKTFTMLGTQSRPGIMALTLIHLFRLIQDDTSSGEYQVNLSYLEIYNENIRDLLTTKLSETFLDLKETKKGVVVPGITTVSAYSANDVLNFLTEGNKHRTCESTGANEVSSRSHAILQVSVVYTSYNHSGQKEERLGKLSMIDLAGSERAAETNNRGIRMIEGASINRSLLALANCINALGSSKRNGYINYRDSKLTRLLKDSLGGNCKTVMIANISPASIHFDETQNTLKYASRAKLIKNKVGHHIEKYAVSTVSQLQAEIGLLKSKMHDKDFDKISMNDQDMSEFKGYLESVDDLFKQHDDLSIKISTIDLQITRNNILLRKQNELLEGFIIIGNEKKNFISNLELNIGKIKRANTALNTTKMEIMERFNEISNNIYIFQRNYTKSDGLDYKYLQLLIKNHFTITEKTIQLTSKDRETCFSELKTRLILLEQTQQVQKASLKEHRVKPTDKLVELYKLLGDSSVEIPIIEINEAEISLSNMSLASNDYPKPITATRKYYSMPKLSRSKFGGSTQTLDIDDYDDIVLRQRQDTEGTFMKRNKSKSNSKLSLS